MGRKKANPAAFALARKRLFPGGAESAPLCTAQCGSQHITARNHAKISQRLGYARKTPSQKLQASNAIAPQTTSRAIKAAYMAFPRNYRFCRRILPLTLLTPCQLSNCSWTRLQ